MENPRKNRWWITWTNSVDIPKYIFYGTVSAFRKKILVGISAGKKSWKNLSTNFRSNPCRICIDISIRISKQRHGWTIEEIPCWSFYSNPLNCEAVSEINISPQRYFRRDPSRNFWAKLWRNFWSNLLSCRHFRVYFWMILWRNILRNWRKILEAIPGGISGEFHGWIPGEINRKITGEIL